MARMLVPRLNPFGYADWKVIFGGAAAWFAVRAVRQHLGPRAEWLRPGRPRAGQLRAEWSRARRPRTVRHVHHVHYLHHQLASGAMLYLFAYAAGSAGSAPGVPMAGPSLLAYRARRAWRDHPGRSRVSVADAGAGAGPVLGRDLGRRPGSQFADSGPGPGHCGDGRESGRIGSEPGRARQEPGRTSRQPGRARQKTARGTRAGDLAAAGRLPRDRDGHGDELHADHGAVTGRGQDPAVTAHRGLVPRS